MANPSIEWTKVLTHPLGLAGYALFLLFGLLARAKRRDERRWILPAALIAAGIVLFGGLGLAYQNVNREAHEKLAAQPATSPTPTPAAPIKQDVRHVTQTSKGNCNPNVISTSTVTVNCSDKSPETKKQPSQKTKQAVDSQ